MSPQQVGWFFTGDKKYNVDVVDEKMYIYGVLYNSSFETFKLYDIEYTKNFTRKVKDKLMIYRYNTMPTSVYSYVIMPIGKFEFDRDIYIFTNGYETFFYIDKYWFNVINNEEEYYETANVTDVFVVNEMAELSLQITDMNYTNKTAKMNWFVKNKLEDSLDVTFTYFPRTSLGNNTNTRNIPVTNACFVKGTPVLTDQGIIAIDRIVPSVHTIRGMKIVDVFQTRLKQDALYRFEKDALYKNVPDKATTMSPNHCVFYKGKMRRAKEFLTNVTKIAYTGEIVYNVLLETHDTMIVNNMIVETLCPPKKITSYSKTVLDLPLTLWHRNRKPFHSLPF
jgi:hypothetical protein